MYCGAYYVTLCSIIQLNIRGGKGTRLEGTFVKN